MIVTAVDGTRLAVDDAGEGTPLVLVHGWCSDRRAWDDMVEALGPGRRVIAVDRRGHGESDAPDDGYSTDGHAEDLGCVLDSLAVGAVVLVAHAGGAPGAMEFTRRHPERVLALVLVDTMLRDGPLRGADGRPSPLEGLAASIGTAGGDEAFAAMYRGFFAEPERPAARRALDAAAMVPPHVRAAEILGIGVDTIAIGSDIGVPVLWLHVGDLDPRVATTFPDVETLHIADAGHFVQIDAPQTVAHAIDDFIDRRVTVA
ncbi:MAG: alpha/beta hydrolase [Acidimicrobiia bacterium]|nr:alpha/beta hydrolase [Acidimicrobiia bacterium]